MWKILYWEFSVMNLSTFLVYSSDRIITDSFFNMLMIKGRSVAVCCIYARTASWTKAGHRPLVQRQVVQVQTKPVSIELHDYEAGRDRST